MTAAVGAISPATWPELYSTYSQQAQVHQKRNKIINNLHNSDGFSRIINFMNQDGIKSQAIPLLFESLLIALTISLLVIEFIINSASI